MSKKSKTSVFPLGFKSSVVICGAMLGLVACSSDSAENDDTGTPTSGPSTTATVTATSAGPTTGGSVTQAAAASTTASVTAASTTGGGTTRGGTTTGGSTTATSGGNSTTGTAAVTSSGTGGTSSTGTMSGAGGMGTTGGNEDFDVTEADFTCTSDWEKVSGFRVTNAIGEAETAASIAVAQDPQGKVFPVGTILQHLPTEAMVKRPAGFSAETRDWEFFLLTLNQDGTTTIAERGTTAIETSMGATCVSCHSDVPEDYDFVCNLWADASGGMPDWCGFDFGEQQLSSAEAMDPRCD